MSDDIDRKAEAHRARNRRHYRRHRDEILEQQRADYQESVSYYKPHLSASEKQRRDRRNARRRQRYAENRERILEEKRANYCAISAREYYEANRCHILERAKRYYRANRERMKAQSIERYHRLKAERDAEAQ